MVQEIEHGTVLLKEETKIQRTDGTGNRTLYGIEEIGETVFYFKIEILSVGTHELLIFNRHYIRKIISVPGILTCSLSIENKLFAWFRH
jgi:hypothetical protein